MEEEDEFGDLYADVLVENSTVNANNPSATLTSKPIYEQFDDDDDEVVLYGKSSPSTSHQQQVLRESQPAEIEDDDFDLNGTRSEAPGVSGHADVDASDQDAIAGKSEMEWNYSEADEFGAAGTQASGQDNLLKNPETKEDEFDDGNGEIAVLEPPNETVAQDTSVHASVETAENNMQEFGEENGSPQVNNSIPGIGVVSGGAMSIPGISSYHEDGGEGNGDNFVAEGSERQELMPTAEMAGIQNQDAQMRDEWDSDSEDDLQIVLNDDRVMYQTLERGDRDFEEGSEDEDGDDLVIVAGDDHPIEEQEWGVETQLPLDGLASTSGDKTSPAEKVGDDKGQNGKGNVGIGNGGIARVGYGNQHYHPHYSYKYVRPGATAIPGGALSSSGGAQNHLRPPISSGGVWGPGKGVATTGRGDWIPGGGRGSVPRSSLPGPGMPAWTGVPGARGFQNTFEFTLPPSKTIFEIDIDSFEEKPWKLPGIDITDFFNFNLDEDGWKQYCRQLEQLRLEATMQSKIRVYESGRSEQEYDPDLPPELAAAAGLPEVFGESAQNRPSELGSSVPGRGRGTGRGRAPIPTGRAIQVEGGGSERRPSVDFRRPRFHDSDAVIEIVLQDASMDDTTDPSRVAEGCNDTNEKEDSEKDDQDFEGDQKQDNPEYFLQTQHSESWERVNDDPKASSGGVLIPRTLHHGDGILPLPPDPPFPCQPGSVVGPAVFTTRILDQRHDIRRSHMMKPNKGFPQLGHERENGIAANQDVRRSRADSFRKDRMVNGVERAWSPEIGHPMDDIERKLTPDVRCMNLEQHAVEDMHIDSRSDGQSKPNSEARGEEYTTDDHGSVHSVKEHKLSSHESPVPVGGYVHRFKVSKSGNSKADSGNSRAYSKDRGNSRDYTRGRGNVEEEITQYRPQKRPVKDGNKLHFDEDSHPYDDYVWNGRHNNEKDSRHQKSRELLHHREDDPYLHGDHEEVYHRRAKDERIDRLRERDEHVKPWYGKNEDLRNLREKDEDSWRRDNVSKDGGLQHRDRRQNNDRDERQDHLLPRKRKDEDDMRVQIDREDARRGEKEDDVMTRQEKVGDPYIRRKKDEDLTWKDRVDKDEVSRNIREREDMVGEKNEKADEYRRRRKEEDLRRRERSDKDQNIRDPREREDIGHEKNERDGGYLRRKDEDTRKRERLDKDQGMRELRDRDEMHREKHERDDEYLRRKEEDVHRRERTDKDEGLRDLREREEISRERSEREDDYHFRRREEESRRRSILDDSRMRKQRDDSWRRREKEDENWRKPGIEETHYRREREDDKSIIAGRSKRQSEEKMWHGSDRERARSREEASLSSIDKDRLKDKRKSEDPRVKVKDRVEETGRSRHHERDDLYLRMDRNSRLDRSHPRYDHTSSGHSLEDQKMYREKRTLDNRNGLVSSLVDDRIRHDQVAAKRRKTEDYYNTHHEKKASDRSTEDQESGTVWTVHTDRRTHNRIMPPDLSKRMHEHEGSDRNISKLKRLADDSVSEDEQLRRGRSKLERWTSQKEKEEANLWDNDARKHHKMPANHEDTVARKEEETKIELSFDPESKQKPGKECPQSQEGDDRIADQEEKEAISDEPVHVAEGMQADTDKSGNRQHCEAVAKLEKRRERFKQPIQNEKDSQRKAENEVLLENETDEVKQERPARKRRWGSN
ncbi:FIP1[V]-like protein isoform X1 [Cryptomeria japonica]|uniref:FIP1[V]-like protein isoform X1 n=1 Tax=Cryptomeria japonica TaxID=3369 RepID=UPI0027DA7805|nr:FIP1[V]-like protein isoform X1 [Cryptomeria japonica]XP_057827289.2 FIP1[V]-like protein isoform X1 [Cryptomeria japonica]XP_057827290.2 FIP1[V]-like protein isoform X1 [Cryptomeria japonica]